MTAGFWQDRRVLLTGHTGFKGAWLSLYLESLGAKVSGVALTPDTRPNLFSLLAPRRAKSYLFDVRDREMLASTVAAEDPEIVIHLAAQALVIPSYEDPVGTFATNIMGTVNLLDALRTCVSVRSILVITSDKVYKNNGKLRAFTESDHLGGHDPYSASKAAAELVTASMADSFFAKRGIAVHTARAGNVIGGGDWSAHRLIPDLWRARKSAESVALRFPNATRPWQHVLEPLFGYVSYIELSLSDSTPRLPRALNFGPANLRPVTVREVAEKFETALGGPRSWHESKQDAAPESLVLDVDSSNARHSLGWRSYLTTEQAIDWTVSWYLAFESGENMREYSLAQIDRYHAQASLVAKRGPN